MSLQHHKRTEVGGRTEALTFGIALKLEPEGPEVLHEPVLDADLADMKSETWLNHMRKGRAHVTLDDLRMELLPVRKKGQDRVCRQLIMKAAGPDGEVTCCVFDIHAMSHVADRASRRLIAQGIMKAGQLFYYHVIARRGEDPATATAGQGQPGIGKFTVRHAPLIYLTCPLPPLLREAEAVGTVNGWCPVFYTREVFSRAEEYSRRGAACSPTEESGGVILGSLCTCPETGELFVVASTVIEVLEAQRTGFSLTYSSKTWTRIQAVLKARQAKTATRTERIVGQCHGHNFLPDYGQKKCHACEEQPSCLSTSVFVSEQDLLWSRSVFASQPWAFCHVFGLNARAEHVHGQFGFRGGRLVERGFYLIDEPRWLEASG